MAWTKAKTVVVIATVAVTGLIATIATKSFIHWRHNVAVARRTAELARLRANVWPGERSQAEEKIKARQAVDETSGAVPIDLTPYVNAKLTDAPLCWPGNNANNLAELPTGVHIYGGVPFNVQGAIYLTGGWLKKHYHKKYPLKVDGIQVDRRCTKIHLLHGAGYVLYTDYGKTIAQLVFHYADGSERQTNIVAGKNVCDMWVPLFTSGIPKFLDMSPGNEPAWTGSNDYIKKWQPELSLVLYKSTFSNPQPDMVLSSVDYISSNTMAVPLIVGLTVEQ